MKSVERNCFRGSFLKTAKKQGILVFMDDKRMTSSDTVRFFELLENYTYMQDYEANEQGKINRINFQRITQY